VVDSARALKMADRVKVIVAEMLETRVKDPRLGFVTITDARMTGDLQHATVFYTVLGSEEERTASAAALESAKGVLRSEVGKQTGLRLTPTLEFLADAVPENASHIDDLLAAAAERDAQVAALAADKAFAGDPDPYRRPLVDIDDSDDSDDSDDEDGDDV
jgi:ribosome-binding factor A